MESSKEELTDDEILNSDLGQALDKVIKVSDDIYQGLQDKDGGISDRFVMEYLSGFVCVNINRLARMSPMFDKIKDEVVKQVVAMILVGTQVDIESLRSNMKKARLERGLSEEERKKLI